ncbi:MAG: ribose-phosphate pyrophosphokinase [Spirochaetales bacterium]|nr:ribose-phosphate pyrophosphokinase [Spirochaetales bacterium]
MKQNNTQAQHNKKKFFTPENYTAEQARLMHSTRGPLLIASCRSGTYLTERVVERYEQLLTEAGSHDNVLYLPDIDKRFSDSEACVRLEHHVNGYDVFLFQTLFNPNISSGIDENYMAFFVAARAFREHGAKHITGIIPYLAYSRQDKPTAFKREPITAKLMADLSIVAGVDHFISWAPHCGQVRGFYGSTPVDFLDPLTLFMEEFSQFEDKQNVIVVAPDVGASKFVTHFGRAMNINSAIASKYRPEPEKVVISEIIGDFRNKKVAIILDDMISNAGTVYALTQKLIKENLVEEVHIGVSHNLCVGKGLERLQDLYENYALKQVIVTNSIPQTPELQALPFVKVKCLSDSLSRTINRIHYNKSVSEVFYIPK